jgi:hypothetical protein
MEYTIFCVLLFVSVSLWSNNGWVNPLASNEEVAKTCEKDGGPHCVKLISMCEWRSAEACKFMFNIRLKQKHVKDAEKFLTLGCNAGDNKACNILGGK